MRTGGELDGLADLAARTQAVADGLDEAGRTLARALDALAAGTGDVAPARAAAHRVAHAAPAAARLLATWAGTLAAEARGQRALFGSADR